MSLSAGRPSRGNKPATLSDLSDQKKTVRVNFDLDRDLHQQLKIYAIQHGKSIREIFEAHVRSLK